MSVFLKRTIYITVVFCIISATAGAQNNADIRQYPEIELVYSNLEVFEAFVDPTDRTEIVNTECPVDPATIRIPDRLLFDENGVRRPQDEIHQIVIDTTCLFREFRFTFHPLYSIINSEQFSVLLGDRVENRDGLVLDGSKQSVRSILVRPALINFLIGAGDLDHPILEFDTCKALRLLASEGPTIEVRWAAFATLVIHQAFLESGGSTFSECSTPIEQTSEELLESARNGDITATVQLGTLFLFEFSVDSNYSSSDLPFLTDAIERFELLIQDSSGPYPLVALAASVTLNDLIYYHREASLE